MRLAIYAFTLLLASPLLGQNLADLPPKQIFETTKKASVLILSGEGAGRLHSVATGVLVAENGILLTALHAVKDTAEVQIRTSSGEVFDHVQLLGSDERRDIAALKIPVSGLTFLSAGKGTSLAQGDHLYTVNNSNGLAWTASEGILSAVRPAGEIPGAGTGFQLIQFTAPIAPGASGGALVDKHGVLVGIITSGLQGSAFFAVPVENVIGLIDASHPIALGSGSLLQLRSSEPEASTSSVAAANADPKQLLRAARTVYIHSKTEFLTVDTLDRALLQEKDWKDLSLAIVADAKIADLFIEIDRPLFTYVHTFVISDRKTSVILGSGKVTAFDGTIASDRIAKQITQSFVVAHRSASIPKP